jgi:hypothetical protein
VERGSIANDEMCEGLAKVGGDGVSGVKEGCKTL